MIPNKIRFLAAALLAATTTGFVAPPTAIARGRPSAKALFGIAEWREETLTCHLNHDNNSSSGPRRIPLYPMCSNKVVLPGERLYLQFTQDAQVRLFQQALDHHHGVFGVGYVSRDEETAFSTISLVQIEDYNMMGGEFGIFLAVQVVGRAELVEHNECNIAYCTELHNLAEDGSSLQEVVELGQEVERLLKNLCLRDNGSRLVLGGISEDRWDRYLAVRNDLLKSDCSGNATTIPHTGIGNQQDDEDDGISWKKLNAMSWAAFCTSSGREQDARIRLGALGNDSISDRLLLAKYWLSDDCLEGKERTM